MEGRHGGAFPGEDHPLLDGEGQAEGRNASLHIGKCDGVFRYREYGRIFHIGERKAEERVERGFTAAGCDLNSLRDGIGRCAVDADVSPVEVPEFRRRLGVTPHAQCSEQDRALRPESDASGVEVERCRSARRIADGKDRFGPVDCQRDVPCRNIVRAGLHDAVRLDGDVPQDAVLAPVPGHGAGRQGEG